VTEPTKPPVYDATLGAQYGDDDAAKRKAARNLRKMSKRNVFLLTTQYQPGLWYVNKDIRLGQIPSGRLDFIRALTDNTVDIQAVVTPIEEAIIAIGYAFSPNPSIKPGRTRREILHKQQLSVDKIEGAVDDDYGIPEMIGLIRKSLEDVDTALDNIKELISYYNDENRNSHERFIEIMFSELISQYRKSLEWMKYVEDALSDMSNKADEVAKSIKTLDPYKTKQLDTVFVKASLNKNSTQKLLKYTTIIQSKVSELEKIYQQIISKTYEDLDKLRTQLYDIAEKNGITVVRDIERRSSASFTYTPDAVGYVNGGHGKRAIHIV
jgi:hypothetical protein